MNTQRNEYAPVLIYWVEQRVAIEEKIQKIGEIKEAGVV